MNLNLDPKKKALWDCIVGFLMLIIGLCTLNEPNGEPLIVVGGSLLLAGILWHFLPLFMSAWHKRLLALWLVIAGVILFAGNSNFLGLVIIPLGIMVWAMDTR